MTDQRDRPLHATIAVVLAIATAGYLAPWAIAAVLSLIHISEPTRPY